MQVSVTACTTRGLLHLSAPKKNLQWVDVVRSRPWGLFVLLSQCKCHRMLSAPNGVCAHYVMVSKFQWKPFWLATQRDPQNDWTATQNRVNYDVLAQAPFHKELAVDVGCYHFLYDSGPEPLCLSFN